MISYAIFVSIPKAAEIASGIISGKMPDMGSAIGEATSAGFAPVQGWAGRNIGGRVSEIGADWQVAGAGPIKKQIGKALAGWGERKGWIQSKSAGGFRRQGTI